MRALLRGLRILLPSNRAKILAAIIYGFSTLPFFIIAALVWGAVAVDKLFVCTDSMGPIDFIPPFVHSCCNDHYVASPVYVWTLWTLLVLSALAIPAFGFSLLAIASSRMSFRPESTDPG
jgi:hypothetical protein